MEILRSPKLIWTQKCSFRGKSTGCKTVKDHPEHFVNNLGLTQCFGQNFHHFARVLWDFAFLRWIHQNQLFFHCMLQCLIQHHMNALHHAGTQSTFFQLRLWKCQGRRQRLPYSSSGAILPASDTVSGSLASFLPFRESKFVFEWPRRITQSRFFILFSSRSHGGRTGLACLPIRAGCFGQISGDFFKNINLTRNFSLNISPDALCFFGYSYIMYCVEYYPGGGAV